LTKADVIWFDDGNDEDVEEGMNALPNCTHKNSTVRHPTKRSLLTNSNSILKAKKTKQPSNKGGLFKSVSIHMQHTATTVGNNDDDKITERYNWCY
jgi:hypothetical protein